MQYVLSPTAHLYHSDCREALRSLPDCSVDSVVTDPPYALTQASRNGSARTNDPETPFGRTKLGERGFMGKTWDTGEVAFDPVFWAEVLRVLKPGGHVAAFGASRGYHRMACAIEDAGFEIRDSLMWVYGTGFPKSHDVSKGIDKAAGAEREVIATVKKTPSAGSENMNEGWVRPWAEGKTTMDITAPATDAAREWEGWGTALKPAFEPIVLARKPLSEGTVAANVLRWGTGALNIGATRIGTEVRHAAFTSLAPCHGNKLGDADTAAARRGTQGEPKEYVGRWPANVVHDGSDEVVGAFPNTGGSKRIEKPSDCATDGNTSFDAMRGNRPAPSIATPAGSAARFFYSAKASKADRNGSKHPTVKPIALMEWLATLITPPGGTVLDPFAGSGTTAIAASNKGFSVVVCEREAEYIADIRARFGSPIPTAIRPTISSARLRAWNAAILTLAERIPGARVVV